MAVLGLPWLHPYPAARQDRWPDAPPAGSPPSAAPRSPRQHEPQPRQRAQLDGKPKPITWTPAMTRVDERDISASQREVPDKVVRADVRERPQLVQLIIREQACRHRHHPTQNRANDSDSSGNDQVSRHRPQRLAQVSHMRCFPAITTGTPGRGGRDGPAPRRAGPRRVLGPFAGRVVARRPHRAARPPVPPSRRRPTGRRLARANPGPARLRMTLETSIKAAASAETLMPARTAPTAQ